MFTLVRLVSNMITHMVALAGGGSDKVLKFCVSGSVAGIFTTRI